MHKSLNKTHTTMHSTHIRTQSYKCNEQHELIKDWRRIVVERLYTMKMHFRDMVRDHYLKHLDNLK